MFSESWQPRIWSEDAGHSCLLFATLLGFCRLCACRGNPPDVPCNHPQFPFAVYTSVSLNILVDPESFTDNRYRNALYSRRLVDSKLDNHKGGTEISIQGLITYCQYKAHNKVPAAYSQCKTVLFVLPFRRCSCTLSVLGDLTNSRQDKATSGQSACNTGLSS